jgi:dTDP-4-amino-4,6-dideoxygalactose transaminase
VKVPFVDLRAEYRQQQAEIAEAVSRVLDSGRYILGPEVATFEAEFAAFCGLNHAIGLASGTDALLLALRALDIGPGDEVITVSHTAVATVVAVELCGARPVLVDVDPATFTMDPAALERALSDRTKAILPVHLYGQPADLAPILDVAGLHGLAVIEDCAQAHGARYQGRPVGTFGDLAAFSFYPTKNLGAFGDGGALVTRSAELAGRVRELRQYGWRQRYVSETTGLNSRLDELQAAVLRVKLKRVAERNALRRRWAGAYRTALSPLPLTLPPNLPDTEPVYHLYVIQVEQRDALRLALADEGIGTAIHYPVPVHRQPAFHHLGLPPGSLPVTEELAGRILSLPMHPYLTEDQVDRVAGRIAAFLNGY